MKMPRLLLACLVVPFLASASPADQPEMQAAIEARRDGRYDEALRIVKQRFDRMASGAKETRREYFITMFEWEHLAAEHVTARMALISERDEQVRRLLEGDIIFCADDFLPITRFRVVMEMNQSLQDSRATYRLLMQLLDSNPALARREIQRAMPAIVEAGDYALAVQYIPNPLNRLDDLNRLARELPLYPVPNSAPRLGAELGIFMGDVVLLSKSLKGLGKDAEAEQLRTAALSGLQSDELRALASRELAESGSIIRAIAEHQMRQAMGPASASAP
ncbi:hypothetical protein [Massilia sp. NR 4-1]|uniref:hypothetical protein n=1 Tax=Massilia sp. NR 4-1 TaxID=1678028 RepID=UPI00067E3A22|nr:hypothetical protein [Massilia sp. NR 4-1]AKU21397.1 hypothetical protein ACZ75_07805 [Massilia sp. NR 4-1]